MSMTRKNKDNLLSHLSLAHTQKPSYLCPQFYHVRLHLTVGLIQIFDFFIQLFEFFVIFDTLNKKTLNLTQVSFRFSALGHTVWHWPLLALCLIVSMSTLLTRAFFMAVVARGQPERLSEKTFWQKGSLLIRLDELKQNVQYNKH